MGTLSMVPRKSKSRGRSKSQGKRSSSKKRGSSNVKAASSSKRRASRSAAASKSASSTSKAGRASSVPSIAEDDVTLTRAPITTLYYFSWSAYETVVALLADFVRSKFFQFLLLPCILAYGASLYLFADLYASPKICSRKCPAKSSCTAADFDGGILWQIELVGLEIAWWVLLGILSSVGFGTGLHSGIMFLFPHIMQVVFACESCSLDGMKTMYLHPCKFECVTPLEAGQESPATFFDLWLRCALPLMAWGFGTAIGELPPYFISRTASRTQGKRDEEFEKELQESKEGTDAFSKMKKMTVDFTERYGFWGVFLLASWPNAAFDMCGMCCGYLDMPFWTFFIATALGKGVVKVNGQAIFFICLFGGAFFKAVLVPVAHGAEKVLKALSGVLPASAANLDVAEFLTKQRKKIIGKFHKEGRFSFAEATGGAALLTKPALLKLYKSFDDKKEIVERIFTTFDANKDGKLSEVELAETISGTDGKFSLGTLDPDGASDGIVKMAWDAFLAGVIIFFFVSIINQMALSKVVELQKKGK
ncbi:unnamed protein product [Amoebophrya sp. A25]|nr:unnamed protein product [Amoebophrya sp. A25]|eukprot:GSA25T00005749001.1